jgi:peptidase A4-like protein
MRLPSIPCRTQKQPGGFSPLHGGLGCGALALTTALVALLLGSASALATPVVHRPSTVPRHSFGRGTSTNWSGYAVSGSGGNHVIGTWTEQPVTCAPTENSWSSPWVGIDGDTSNTVEQIGTDSDCQNGSPVYYAWYEMYPKGLVTVSLPVSPGQSFTGEVTPGSAGRFTLKLTNNTTHQSFSTTQTNKRARRSSVEWIMEGPSNGLLSNFGTGPFSASSGSINGQTASLGSLSNADPITMVTNSGVVRAQPSSPPSGGSFSVTWKHS